MSIKVLGICSLFETVFKLAQFLERERGARRTVGIRHVSPPPLTPQQREGGDNLKFDQMEPFTHINSTQSPAPPR